MLSYSSLFFNICCIRYWYISNIKTEHDRPNHLIYALFFMEMRRIELLSENPSARFSPITVDYLKFPTLTQTNMLKFR